MTNKHFTSIHCWNRLRTSTKPLAPPWSNPSKMLTPRQPRKNETEMRLSGPTSSSKLARMSIIRITTTSWRRTRRPSSQCLRPTASSHITSRASTPSRRPLSWMSVKCRCERLRWPASRRKKLKGCGLCSKSTFEGSRYSPIVNINEAWETWPLAHALPRSSNGTRIRLALATTTTKRRPLLSLDEGK